MGESFVPPGGVAAGASATRFTHGRVLDGARPWARARLTHVNAGSPVTGQNRFLLGEALRYDKCSRCGSPGRRRRRIPRRRKSERGVARQAHAQHRRANEAVRQAANLGCRHSRARRRRLLRVAEVATARPPGRELQAATAASRRPRSTWTPRSRDGSRIFWLPRETSSARDRCSPIWTPGRSWPSGARPSSTGARHHRNRHGGSRRTATRSRAEGRKSQYRRASSQS